MPAFTREFPLDPEILGQGSAVNLAVDAPGSPAAAAAIAANRPFPDGPIALGQISVGAGTGSGLVFKSGAATVSFMSSAEIQAGIGIFDSPADAVASFALPSAKNLDLGMLPAAGAEPARWAAMRWAYSVTGSVSGTYPIGLVGGGVGRRGGEPRPASTASCTASTAAPARATCSRRRRKAGACRGR